ARLDRPDGELLCRLAIADDYDGVWKYVQTTIRPASGKRDLYLLLQEGTGQLLLQSFKLGHSHAVSPLRVSVGGYGNETQGTVAKVIRRLNWDARPERLHFTTGENGTEAVVSIANEGKYFVYVDDCGLWNPNL
ncbi:MAG: hypothetical protein J7639_31545, partial [Paenibacillaceae bacterium]|nr:hypothetical protein [Paenibacillaceae bacterium]